MRYAFTAARNFCKICKSIDSVSFVELPAEMPNGKVFTYQGIEWDIPGFGRCHLFPMMALEDESIYVAPEGTDARTFLEMIPDDAHGPEKDLGGFSYRIVSRDHWSPDLLKILTLAEVN